MKALTEHIALFDQNNAPLTTRVFDEHANELIMFFGEKWYRPHNRRTIAAARALAVAIMAGGRGPKIVDKQDANNGHGEDFKYATRWVVAFDVPPPDCAFEVPNGVGTDHTFGRGNESATAKVVDGRLLIYAEQ